MLNKATHEALLIKILKDIYSDDSIGPLLGFKGGTACSLFYNLPRFSVDLDFDLLDATKQELVMEKIEKILMRYGTIKDKSKKRNTLFFLLSFEKGSSKIKVDINLRPFPSQYKLMYYLGIGMLVMEGEDIFAHKLIALLERKKFISRDLFDIDYFYDKHWHPNEEIIRVRSGKKYLPYLKKCIEHTKKTYNEKNIMTGLGELITEKQKYYVRHELKKHVIDMMQIEYSVMSKVNKK